ncbi:unnamed protein product, partial [marine sediment metagenome]
MPLPWIKMWVEALDDPKLTRMSLAERGAWWGILKLTRKCGDGNKIVSGGEGLSVDEIAEALHIKTDEDRQALESMITKMGKRGSLKWIENILTVVHWEERQRIPPSAEREAVAERVRKYRERQKRLGETPEVISEMAERPRARDSKKATRSGDSEEATRVPRVRASHGGQPGDSKEATRSQGGQPGDSKEATRSQGGQPGDSKEATRSQDKEIMAVWSGIKNFPPVSQSLTKSFLAEMRAEFPGV